MTAKKTTKSPAKKATKPAAKDGSRKTKRVPYDASRGGEIPAATPKKASPFTSDPRLPPVGSTIQRAWHKKVYEVTVREDGFLYAGETFRSLTAVAKKITGAASINGLLYFGLAGRPAAKPGEGKRGSKKAARDNDADAAPAETPAETPATPADAPTATEPAPEKPAKGTPEQVASVAKARAARAAKVAAKKAKE